MNKTAVDQFMRNSDLVYFKPTRAFFDFFLQSEWKWRKYHDCGAGSGLLTQGMRKKGIECVAYDLHPREQTLVPVEQLDTARIADLMDWSEVALIARPCHHPQFVEATICSALEMGEAFYIGLPKNLGPDLVEFQYDVLRTDVGEGGEVLVRIRCQLEKHLVYRQIINPGIARKEWWWYNSMRRRYTSEPRGLAGFEDNLGKTPVVVLDEVHLANDLQVLIPKAEACDDNSNAGWIAPDGEWFGCRYAEHDYIARAVLGCSIRRLEALGFCRCSGEMSVSRLMWTHGTGIDAEPKKVTAKQRRTLIAKGYNPDW